MILYLIGNYIIRYTYPIKWDMIYYDIQILFYLIPSTKCSVR